MYSPCCAPHSSDPLTPFLWVSTRSALHVNLKWEQLFQSNAKIFLCFENVNKISLHSYSPGLSSPRVCVECAVWTLPLLERERERALINLKWVVTARVNIYTWCSQILFFLITFPHTIAPLALDSTGPSIPVFPCIPVPVHPSHSINSDLIPAHSGNLCLTSLSISPEWYCPWSAHNGGLGEIKPLTRNCNIQYSNARNDSFLFSTEFPVAETHFTFLLCLLVTDIWQSGSVRGLGAYDLFKSGKLQIPSPWHVQF